MRIYGIQTPVTGAQEGAPAAGQGSRGSGRRVPEPQRGAHAPGPGCGAGARPLARCRPLKGEAIFGALCFLFGPSLFFFGLLLPCAVLGSASYFLLLCASRFWLCLDVLLAFCCFLSLLLFASLPFLCCASRFLLFVAFSFLLLALAFCFWACFFLMPCP